MRRRRRLIDLENAVRGIVGQPQLVRSVPVAESVRVGTAVEREWAMPITPLGSRPIAPAAEHDAAMPVRVELGPVRVRGGAKLSARLDVRGAEVTVPNTPERQAAAFATVATGMAAGGWMAEQVSHDRFYMLVGAAAGWWGAARLWNRWNREGG